MACTAGVGGSNTVGVSNSADGVGGTGEMDDVGMLVGIGGVEVAGRMDGVDVIGASDGVAVPAGAEGVGKLNATGEAGKGCMSETQEISKKKQSITPSSLRSTRDQVGRLFPFTLRTRFSVLGSRLSTLIPTRR